MHSQDGNFRLVGPAVVRCHAAWCSAVQCVGAQLQLRLWWAAGKMKTDPALGDFGKRGNDGDRWSATGVNDDGKQ